jgi:glycosyltransferase involved in cell wall biosynthesis
LGSGQKRNLQVVFAGDAQGRGEYREALLREIEARGAQGMVHVVGHCADMPAAYAWADIVLSPSTRPEAFGRVAVEAGAMGKPVISSDHGGARETIVDGCSGVLTPPGDVTALSDAIEALAEMSETKRAAMGAAARERVRRRYSTEAMCEATIAAYKRLAS